MEGEDEIAQDSSCARVYMQGRFAGAGDIGIDPTDGAIDLRSVPRKSKKRVQKRSHLFPAVYEYSYIIFSKKRLVLSCEKQFVLQYKSNDLEPHFQTSATRSRTVEGTESAATLPHCCGCAKESFGGREIFGSTILMELWWIAYCPTGKNQECCGSSCRR